MTETTKTVLEAYQVRKSKKQKEAFIQYVQAFAAEKGYTVTVEKGSLGARNIVVGDPDRAKVVYTAHYDTCAQLPFPNFITPKNFAVYLLYQIVLVCAFLAIAYVIGFLFGWLSAVLAWGGRTAYLLSMATYWCLLLLLVAGPANKHTANDNTSGVTVLLDVMAVLPAEQKANVAFVFFDLEEAGMFGSMAFSRKHKQAMKQKLLLNFDCVSDGETMLLVLKKQARPYREAIAAAFTSNESVTVEIADRGVFYPSDQMCFPCGVGVAALKKMKRLNLLYMDRIHTSRDTVYREENIAFLTKGAVALAERL